MNAIAADLRALGVESGQIVLLHSSLRSLGWVDGGANTVIEALLAAISPGGTVLVPTLTGTAQDSPRHPPEFDPAVTPCWTGMIPETFRQRPEARRSRHPTHSVAAIGPAAEYLVAGHEYVATPCAADSPYGKLAREGGRILLLGVTHESNTCLHMLEELAGVPYHMQDQPCLARVRRPDGSWEEIETALHLWRWDRDFPKVGPLLSSRAAQVVGQVGAARATLVDAGAMTEILLPMLRGDPLYLLSAEARAGYVAAR
jgi:aminoglycoside 3-N-acetyltransferase